MPGLPKVNFPLVDVRDVAQAHLQAVKVPEARNQRFILTENTYSFKMLSEHLKSHYGDKYPTKTEEMAECPPGNPRFAIMWGKEYKLDRSKSESILGIKYHNIKDTVVDMSESMINLGMLPDNRSK